MSDPEHEFEVALALRGENRIVERLDATPPATLWDGRVPRTAQQSAVLLSTKPGGWEYLLFAGTLVQSVYALDVKYRDHELSYARPSDTYVSTDDAVDYVRRAFAKIESIVAAVNLLFAPTAFARAFGEPGADGDPERIAHLARRTVAMYEDLMDWAADLRGVSIASKYKPLIDIAARFADEPIEEFRQYVDDLVTKVDAIPEHMKKPEPRGQLTIKAALHLTVDQQVADEFNAEIARLSQS